MAESMAQRIRQRELDRHAAVARLRGTPLALLSQPIHACALAAACPALWPLYEPQFKIRLTLMAELNRERWSLQDREAQLAVLPRPKPKPVAPISAIVASSAGTPDVLRPDTVRVAETEMC
jgi:hypothetical protein